VSDPTRRFSRRVEDYVRYRPGYPIAVIDTLRTECGLTPDSVVADVGSGTGILTELFLRNGNTVWGVEPNREMREAGERLLAGYSRFTSVDGRAEATTLAGRSVDFVVAGQAFHWFDREEAREEFLRVLRGGGWVVLVWNERLVEASPFLIEYEALLHRHATDYAKVDHRQVGGAALAGFYGKSGYRRRSFPNRQVLDFDGVRGRLLSSSYVPGAGDPGYEPMLADLERLFLAHAANGHATFEYETKLYFGRLA
jgi:SAM-dependent methyltransferase